MSKSRHVRVIWGAIAAITSAAAVFAVAPYITADPGQSRIEPNESFPLHFPLLLVHIWSSFLALLIGWVQFVPGLRNRRPDFHRWAGLAYLGLVAIGGITGLTVGMLTESYVRQMAFLTLALLWLFTGWNGYRKARLGRFVEHKRWMIRNYALTLVAASARLLTPLCILIYLAGHGLQPGGGIAAVLEPVLEINIWIGLVVNVVIAEWALLSPHNRS